MKKTVQVNIGGCAFNVDEDSYALVDAYIKSLQEYYHDSADGKEIISDIEERMAELLLERCGSGNVVSAPDVRYVIGILGTPASFSDQPADRTSRGDKTAKRLYRNPEGRVIGGVCSGFAAYLNWDVALIRILMVVLFLGSFALDHIQLIIPLIYIICWIAMPNADTVQKQCEMRGEQLSAAGIEQRVKSGKDTPARPAGQTAGRILGFICGFILFIAGLSALGSGLFAATLPAFASLNPDIAEAITDLMAEIGLTAGLKSLGVTTVILAMMVYFIPCIIAIYYGILLMFGLKSPSWRPGLILVLIWVVALVVLIPLLVIDIAALL